MTGRVISAGLLLLWIAFFPGGCGSSHGPDVSDIKVNIQIERFDKAFFEAADTSNSVAYISRLEKQFPFFTNDFFQFILGLPRAEKTDSAYPAYEQLRLFYRVSKPLYDSISHRIGDKDIKQLKLKLEDAFKHVKYYFPDYEVPRIITYIGPFNAPGIALTNNALAIGLQLFAGKDFSFYSSMEGQELYPLYISCRFEPSYIPAGCMKAVIEDMYPDRSQGRPLIEQMIEKGKVWYALDKILPDMPDSLKTDYTEGQLKWVKANEALVWNYLLQNQSLYVTDPFIVKTFIGEAPSTYGMPDASPGNIGPWVGREIIKAYAGKMPEKTLADIMDTNAKEIFTGSKYKPR